MQEKAATETRLFSKNAKTSAAKKPTPADIGLDVA